MEHGGKYRRILFIVATSIGIIVVIWSWAGVNILPMKTKVIELTPTTTEKEVKQ